MTKQALILSWSVCLLLACACNPAFEVYDLRCEGLSEPLGIDSASPHFSWKIRSAEPMEQTAYEIQVAGSRRHLLAGKPDLWEGGKVESPDQVMVPYAGKELTSRSLAWWRVRVWKSGREASRWSRPQRFSIGIIGSDSLKGQYIGAVPGEGRAPLLRKQFSHDGKGTALLHVNTLGYHEAYINGERVSDATCSAVIVHIESLHCHKYVVGFF